MNNTTSTTKHRRTAAEIRDEYERFVEQYQLGLTPFEIMRKLSISMVQYTKYFAQSISSNDITLASHKYGTCSGKHLPEAIRTMLHATKEDLIRFEPVDDNRVVLTKVEI